MITFSSYKRYVICHMLSAYHRAIIKANIWPHARFAVDLSYARPQPGGVLRQGWEVGSTTSRRSFSLIRLRICWEPSLVPNCPASRCMPLPQAPDAAEGRRHHPGALPGESHTAPSAMRHAACTQHSGASGSSVRHVCAWKRQVACDLCLRHEDGLPGT